MSERSSTEWRMREAEAEGWRELHEAFGLHPVVSRVLARRGFESADQVEGFLEPRLADMHDPFSMADMESAIDTLLEAIEAGDRIVIHGDYDVDGLCGTALLVDVIEEFGVDVEYLIPHRIHDGYGLNAGNVEELVDSGFDLMITVDCGVTAHEAIGAAREAGMDVVVLDHHQPEDTLPSANAVLNPVREDCDFPFEGLAAVGVAFNFAVALRATLRRRGHFQDGEEPDYRRLLDLVALGTVADIVPLVDENRAFVRRGLALISDRRRPGLRALVDEACPEESRITANHVGFKLAPRLNAAGRIDDSNQCVELLTTRDLTRARKIARRLDALNAERRSIQDEVVEEALEQAQRHIDAGDDILVVDGTDWHRGVLGIVAGRISDRFHRPTIVLERDGDVAKGSARSIEGVDIVALLRANEELLTRFGGHAAAAGLTLPAERVEQLREALQQTLDETLGQPTLPSPTLEVDETVEVGELDRSFIRDLRRLQPFGHGNPEPVLVCRGVEGCNPKIVGEDHLKARFEDSSGGMKGIGFSMAEYREVLAEPVDVAFVPRWNVFRGRGNLEMHLRDLRPNGPEER